MEKSAKYLIIKQGAIFLFAMFLISGAYGQNVHVSFEKVKEKCANKPYEERVRVTVGRFNVTTGTASTTQEFGDNLATMFTNALHEIECFRVLESTSNLNDMTDEISFGQQGYTNSASSPGSGKMLGAQVVFTGEITEFSEGSNSGGIMGVTISNSKAKVGFIVKAINPETREIYFTKSIETESRKPGGYKGVKLLGFKLAGGTKTNAAIADAVERGIIKAAYEVAEEMEKIPFPKANSGIAEVKNWDASNCPLLATGAAPTIMVIVPENYNTQDYRNYNFSDIAVETSIIRRFTESGFTVIDPAMYASQRKGARFNEAFLNPMAAASLGSEFGADIVVVGDASSAPTGQGSMASYRARVDAKAIGTSNSSIIATNGFDAGATDVSANSASQKALSNAGGLLADYLIERMCKNSSSFGGGNTSPDQAITYVQVENTDYPSLKKLIDLIGGSSGVETAKRTAFKGSTGSIEVRHKSSVDIADYISEKAGSICDITGFDGNKLTVSIK